MMMLPILRSRVSALLMAGFVLLGVSGCAGSTTENTTATQQSDQWSTALSTYSPKTGIATVALDKDGCPIDGMPEPTTKYPNQMVRERLATRTILASTMGGSNRCALKKYAWPVTIFGVEAYRHGRPKDVTAHLRVTTRRVSYPNESLSRYWGIAYVQSRKIGVVGVDNHCSPAADWVIDEQPHEVRLRLSSFRTRSHACTASVTVGSATARKTFKLQTDLDDRLIVMELQAESAAERRAACKDVAVSLDAIARGNTARPTLIRAMQIAGRSSPDPVMYQVINLAQQAAKFTPSPKADQILAGVQRVLSFYRLPATCEAPSPRVAAPMRRVAPRRDAG